jgi:hypothetical protein
MFVSFWRGAVQLSSLTFVINAAIRFITIASVALVHFCIFETPLAFLLQRERKERLRLSAVSKC